MSLLISENKYFDLSNIINIFFLKIMSIYLFKLRISKMFYKIKKNYFDSAYIFYLLCEYYHTICIHLINV